MKFCFGTPHEHHSVIVEAKNLEHAIKIFKIEELFPERCVDSSYWKRDEQGCFDSEYDNTLGRYNYRFTDNPKIFIYEETEVWKQISSIELSECIEVDYRSLIPRANLLEGPCVQESEENLPVVINSRVIAQVNSKLELREKHDEIIRKRAELELMIRECNVAMNVLQQELKQKQKIVYILETFLGIHEEIVQIADGEPSTNAPLTLYQQKLYMDEEVGIWDDADGQGLDCRQIEQFDDWIAKHYKLFAYEPLSIVVWQVRRSKKEYGDLWENVQFNSWNQQTYFLIRNGERLYRIWSNVSVGDRLFPTATEYQSLIQEEQEWSEERARQKLQEKHESYLYGMIAIQGIIERTEVLGTRLRERVNLLKPDGIPEDLVKLVRDDETEYWIGDGRLRWRDFLSKNRQTICVGTRVCLSVEKFYFSFSSKESDYWRCEPFRPSNTSTRDCCYSIEASKEESRGTYFPRGTSFVIRYQPGDSVGWDPYTYQEVIRKRRVPWFLYGDEVLNFDEITLEEADYYLKSRLDRKDYLRMLPTLFWIRRVKLRELELEEEFIKMIAGQLKWELDDKNRKKIYEKIQFWKLKNKWKRALTTKESTATRMILKWLS